MFQQSVGMGLALVIGLIPAVARGATVRERKAPVMRLTAAQAGRTQLIVSYHARCAAGEQGRMEESCGAQSRREGYGKAYRVLTLAPGRSAAQEAERLRKDPRVRFAEPDGQVRALATATDPYFSPYQWNMADTGFGIRAPSAWARSTGSGVTVAVVDTGIAYENWGGFLHVPDLAITTFASGWDFVDDDAHANDENGHGTHVAGVIAANANNGYGCAGAAPDARLMPIKVLGPTGTGPTSALADGIRFAADHGAQVINVSVGTAQDSVALREAVEYARSKGVVLVAAAGNDGAVKPVYPAAYPGVISVGATRFDGQRAFYSNYGPNLSVVAPGGDPNVDQNGDGYNDGILQQTFFRETRSQFGFYFKVGTSQAAPHVAAVAALLLAVQPDLTPAQVQEAIEKTATDLGPPGRDDQYGWGLVNAAAAVSYLPSAPVLLGAGLSGSGDDSIYGFESGFQEWNTVDNSRASVFLSSQHAYKGQRSLQVALKGITDYAPGIIRTELPAGTNIPAGRSVTAQLQLAGPGSVSARVVLYDGRGLPIVGSFTPLSAGRWTPISVTIPTWATGPIRWIFIHYRTNGSPFTGNCYVDGVSW